MIFQEILGDIWSIFLEAIFSLRQPARRPTIKIVLRISHRRQLCPPLPPTPTLRRRQSLTHRSLSTSSTTLPAGTTPPSRRGGAAPTRGIVGGVGEERFAEGQPLPVNGGGRGGQLKLAAAAALFWVFMLSRPSLVDSRSVENPFCSPKIPSARLFGLLLQREYLVDIWATDRKY